MTEQEEIVRAERARQVLSDPLVAGAMQDIKTGLIEQWRASPVKDKDLREQIWAIYVGMTKFEEIFRIYIESG